MRHELLCFKQCFKRIPLNTKRKTLIRGTLSYIKKRLFISPPTLNLGLWDKLRDPGLDVRAWGLGFPCGHDRVFSEARGQIHEHLQRHRHAQR